MPGAVGGSEIVARNLLREIARLEPELELVVYCGREAVESLGAEPFGERCQLVVSPAPSSVKPARVAAELTWLPWRARRDRLELLHSLGTTSPPWCPVPSVVTVLDVIYHHFPETFPLASRIGLRVVVPAGVRRADRVIAISEAGKRGEKRRFQASAWLGGYLLGPFKYEGTRSDDPNDVIPHEDRRDLRGGRLLAAWLHHFDAREQNSMDSWMAVDKANPESSPGWVKHYYLDTSDCLGSLWEWDGISRRMGESYLLDFADIGTDFITFGAIERPWERKKFAPKMEMFGYFHWEEFDPERWRNEYPNPAFSRATEHDNAWMARILSRFDRADIAAIVKLGKFTNPEADEFLTEVLEQRLRKIASRYLTRLSPIADVRVDADGRLCATDLARRRAVRPEAEFRYDATVRSDRGVSSVRVDVAPDGGLCVTLPHVAADRASPAYVTVTLRNGVAKGPLEVHLYDFGPSAGHKLAGLVRPDSCGGARLRQSEEAVAGRPGLLGFQRGLLSNSS